jgi:uncharacterized C2H2 Zn-finger protein
MESVCNICGSSFREKCNFVRHLRTVHTVKSNVPVKKSFKCNVCEKEYVHLKDLNFHVRKKHAEVSPVTKSKNIKCLESGCPMLVADMCSLREHMELEHDTPSELENLAFATMTGE